MGKRTIDPEDVRAAARVATAAHEALVSTGKVLRRAYRRTLKRAPSRTGRGILMGTVDVIEGAADAIETARPEAERVVGKLAIESMLALHAAGRTPEELTDAGVAIVNMVKERVEQIRERRRSTDADDE